MSATRMQQATTTENIATGKRSAKSLRYDLLLVIVTIIWGSTFLVTKTAIRVLSPFSYLALIYGLATLALALVFRKRLMRITRAELASGLIIGLFLFAGYALQTVGLQYTTVSKAGFITGLYVPLVPLFSLVFLRQRPAVGTLAGVFLSMVGLVLLSITNSFNLNIDAGEVLMLGCAVAFAMQIVCIGKFVSRADPINLAIVQLALTSLLSALAIPMTHEAFTLPPLPVWGAIAFMSIVDIAFTLLVMNWVQQFVSGTRAALIYALEPVWAALFGLLLAGDALSIPAWIGCGCILLGMVAGRLRLSRGTP